MARDESEDVPEANDTDAFLRWLATVPDPVERYSKATEALGEHQRAVQRLSALRASAVSDAAEESSLSEVARRLNMSRQRAHQLAQEAKARQEKKPGAKRQGRRKGDNTP